MMGMMRKTRKSPSSLYTLVNPEISKMSKETVFGMEGCLSIPELLGDVERAESVTIKAQDRHGKVIKIKAPAGWRASSSTRSTTPTGSCSPTAPSIFTGLRISSPHRKKPKPSKPAPWTTSSGPPLSA